MFIDPDGEFAIGALIFAIGQGATISAGINIASQMISTGYVDASSVGNAAFAGALSAGMSFGVGELGSALDMGNNLTFKTLAHGISGGIQSEASGGTFGSGFAGGAIGNISGHYSGNSIIRRTAVSGLGAGTTQALTGGDFWTGFRAGAYNTMYNWGLHEAQASFKSFYMKNFALTKYGVLDKHYFRNVYNDPSQAHILQSKRRSMFHAPHKKFLSSNGKHESILNVNNQQVGGKLRATYNYGKNDIDHTIRDVLPHIILGP